MHSNLKFFGKRIVFLLNMLIVMSGAALYAQPPVTAPTTQDIKEMLPDNVDPTQLTQKNFKAFFGDNNKKIAVGADKNKIPATDNLLLNAKVTKDSLQTDDVKQNEAREEQTYGDNIFKNAAVLNVAELSTPPLDYPIGVGDHIVVALWGGGEYQEDYIVAKDGSIFPAGLGKITVQGLTFETARALIYSRFKSVVPATTNIQVTLGQPRTINVNVGGEVNIPGPVTVSAFSNAFNVIALAGGVTGYGNLRDIQVKRNGRIIETLDVYNYLTTGDLGKHIYLQNNDFVLVTFFDKKVQATGQFRRPMFYQLKKNEGMKALIKFAGGFTPEAFSSGVKVIRSENETQVIRDVNATAIIKLTNQDFLLVDGDIVRADLIKPGLINKVQLNGDVNYPGTYELRKNDRLFDIINRAGGITASTFLPRAYIFRAGRDSANNNVDKIEVNLQDIASTGVNPNNVLLQSNDIIQLFSNNEFGDQQYVEIFGEIRKEGKVTKYGGMTLQDLIYLSGGLRPSAEFGKLEIVSVVDIDSAQKGLKPIRTISRTYSINSNLEMDSASAKVLLRPFDQVYVRKNPSFHLQQNITIAGIVKYPGRYTKLTPDERLSSFIERAGGILENADLSGCVLFRNKTDMLREKMVITKATLDPATQQALQNAGVAQDMGMPVSIDLKKALENKNSTDDIVLQENDVIFVPEKNPFVAVNGVVQSPLKIAYESRHKSLMYYIDKAGGYGVRPWRKRVFVTYASGKSKRTKNFFFIHFYPKVKSGSTITVPLRPEGKEIGDIAIQAITATIPILIAGFIFKKL